MRIQPTAAGVQGGTTTTAAAQIRLQRQTLRSQEQTGMWQSARLMLVLLVLLVVLEMAH